MAVVDVRGKLKSKIPVLASIFEIVIYFHANRRIILIRV